MTRDCLCVGGVGVCVVCHDCFSEYVSKVYAVNCFCMFSFGSFLFFYLSAVLVMGVSFGWRVIIDGRDVLIISRHWVFLAGDNESAIKERNICSDYQEGKLSAGGFANQIFWETGCISYKQGICLCVFAVLSIPRECGWICGTSFWETRSFNCVWAMCGRLYILPAYLFPQLLS